MQLLNHGVAILHLVACAALATRTGALKGVVLDETSLCTVGPLSLAGHSLAQVRKATAVEATQVSSSESFNESHSTVPRLQSEEEFDRDFPYDDQGWKPEGEPASPNVPDILKNLGTPGQPIAPAAPDLSDIMKKLASPGQQPGDVSDSPDISDIIKKLATPGQQPGDASGASDLSDIIKQLRNQQEQPQPVVPNSAGGPVPEFPDATDILNGRPVSELPNLTDILNGKLGNGNQPNPLADGKASDFAAQEAFLKKLQSDTAKLQARDAQREAEQELMHEAWQLSLANASARLNDSRTELSQAELKLEKASAKRDAVTQKYNNAKELLNETAFVYRAAQAEVSSLREEAEVRYEAVAEAQKELAEMMARVNATSAAYNQTATELEQEGLKMTSLLKDFTAANASLKKLAARVDKVSARSNTVAQEVELARVKVEKAEETVESLRRADPSKSSAADETAMFALKLLAAAMMLHII
mmetsp:Transcript_17447/g.31469  ORF Transcript_17447/g.31469 Transcript_17447/m.31469 type:complete len:474 (-) Transcript_17447:37-1458(-)